MMTNKRAWQPITGHEDQWGHEDMRTWWPIRGQEDQSEGMMTNQRTLWFSQGFKFLSCVTFDLVVSKRPIFLDKSFKFQRILAQWGLTTMEQLICWMGVEITSVRKVRTLWLVDTTPALSNDQDLKKESNKRSMLRWHTDHTEERSRC